MTREAAGPEFDYELLHQQIHRPCVRVIAKRSGGSGTVIYSEENDEGGHSTYVLTNHHVVADLITVKDKWNPILQREVKEDERGTPQVHFFEYKWESRAVGGQSLEADILAYSREEDLALLKLRTDRAVPAVAQLYPREDVKDLRIGMPVYTVGSGLLEPPVMTDGHLAQFGREIEDREFWLNTAPSIYGNSGGALFLAESRELIGVPARIAVTGFFGSDAVTHLSFAIPIDRVWKFLEEQRFRFIEKPDEFTEVSEEKERKRLREMDVAERLKMGDNQ